MDRHERKYGQPETGFFMAWRHEAAPDIVEKPSKPGRRRLKFKINRPVLKFERKEIIRVPAPKTPTAPDLYQEFYEDINKPMRLRVPLIVTGVFETLVGIAFLLGKSEATAYLEPYGWGLLALGLISVGAGIIRRE